MRTGFCTRVHVLLYMKMSCIVYLKYTIHTVHEIFYSTQYFESMLNILRISYIPVHIRTVLQIHTRTVLQVKVH